jgi:SNF2 family DNA or RNA helicase
VNYVISRDRRAVIVPGGEDLPVRIPTARPFDYKGKRLWAVPFNTWEAQVLRTMGYLVPSPIGSYYDWPREITKAPQPFHNQIESAAFLTLNHRAYCLNEIGTGKTMSALWAADWLMREGMVRKALILAPLSTLSRVWSDAVFINLAHRSIGVLYGTAEKRRRLFANNAFDFYVINHDALDIVAELVWGQKRAGMDPVTGTMIYQKILESAQFLRDDIDLVIIDEIGAYRNPGTNRYRILNMLLKPEMWGWGLTGTPIPNAPSDGYSQIKLLTPMRVPQYFTEFRQMTMQQLTDYIWIPRKDAAETVYKAMQPAVRFIRDECFDLPPITYSTREVELTAEQKKHYKELAKQFYTEVGDGKITAVNEGVKASKLLQAACGVIYDNEGLPREINARPRVEAVREIIEQCEHKVIVFVPFTAPLLMLHRELSKHFTCALIHGGVSKGKRDTIFAEFQNLPHPRVLLADAGTMSHGLTLTEASTIVHYGPEFSNDIYTQANGRITRPGQKNNQHIIHIAGTPIEHRIYTRLQERGRMQGILLDMVHKGVAL